MGIKLYHNHAFCLSDFENEMHILQPRKNVTIDIRKNNIIHLDAVLEKTKPNTLNINILNANITLDLNKYKYLQYINVCGSCKTYIRSLPELRMLKLNNCFVKAISSVEVRISLKKTIVKVIDSACGMIKIVKCNKFIYINSADTAKIDSNNKFIRRCYV
jgi:hypothetical protein